MEILSIFPINILKIDILSKFFIDLLAKIHLKLEVPLNKNNYFMDLKKNFKYELIFFN